MDGVRGITPEGLDSLDRPVLVAAENLVAAAREHVVGVAGMPGAVLLEVVAAATADGSAVGIAVVDIEAVCGDVVAGVWVDECEELGTGGVRTVAVPVVRALAGDILAVDVHVADVAVVASQDGDVGSVDLSQGLRPQKHPYPRSGEAWQRSRRICGCLSLG